MKITQDIRDYAQNHGLSDADAIQKGLEEKAKKFKEKGAEIYGKVE